VSKAIKEMRDDTVPVDVLKLLEEDCLKIKTQLYETGD
jgi:hypothetical protein